MTFKISLVLIFAIMSSIFGQFTYIYSGDQVFKLCTPEGGTRFKRDTSSTSGKMEYYFPHAAKEEKIPDMSHKDRGLTSVPVVKEIQVRSLRGPVF